MRITAAGRTDAGTVRPVNQDWLEWDLALGVFLVADGMGGHRAGEVAAHLAIETVQQFVAQSVDAQDLTWPFGFDPSLSSDQNRLVTAVRLANRRVCQSGALHSEFSGMGTTLVAALVRDGRLTVAAVGDSRAYLWRLGTLTQLTTDDTWVETVLGKDPQRGPAEHHPMRHVLTSVIGASDDRPPELVEQTLLPGDRVLLSTDGLHTVVAEADLGARLGGSGPPDEAAAALIEDALARRASDNVTALVIHID
ncbi:MAG: protein phosphatase 2C domain-containing protein [Vicinamibacterales bacterium]|nr:protein phosphatase 2C domain-containing protein [Vicinamibacterales bacterium]